MVELTVGECLSGWPTGIDGGRDLPLFRYEGEGPVPR